MKLIFTPTYKFSVHSHDICDKFLVRNCQQQIEQELPLRRLMWPQALWLHVKVNHFFPAIIITFQFGQLTSIFSFNFDDRSLDNSKRFFNITDGCVSCLRYYEKSIENRRIEENKENSRPTCTRLLLTTFVSAFLFKLSC